MAQSRGRVVGDYLVGRQIGSGSFSVVWHARHRVHGTEVAIKEIAMNRLNNKLRESLMSEIVILRRINHPNIIRLHDIIEVSGKIHLVLEYCRGGDLSLYIQRHGRVPEETAKHFMQQLATGLQILRENNFVHRDLKPQNLLLSTNDDRSVLKIADFGFARSLQERGLAETLCGSPLYMAPEIMQLQKYDAKADLWSVGAILYQLVTGKTPFTGSNQYHLLQNIIKCTELQFPPESMDLSSECKDLCLKLLRRNPVERLTYEEFFNHSFLSRKQLDISSRTPSRTMDCYQLSETDPVKAEESSQDDCFPFFLDDESNACGGSPSHMKRRSSMESTKGLNLSRKLDKRGSESSAIPSADVTSRYSSTAPNLGTNTFRLDIYRSSETNTDHPGSTDRRSASSHSRVADSMDLIDQDYVIVPGPPLEVSSSSTNASKQSHLPDNSLMQASTNKASPSSAPVPIIGASISNSYHIGSLESHGSAPGTSLDSMDIGDALEKPSSNCRTRIKSLQQCASCIKELVAEKIEGRFLLEAFSIQLVILAIWKQVLHICHTQAASAMEGSPGQGNTRLRRSNDRKNGSPSTEECLGDSHMLAPEEFSQIEGEFLQEVEHAEELAKVIEPGGTEMPDAMETIFQAALAFGKHGGVEELMGNMERAASMYAKAVNLLIFLLVEAPSLILNPPFSLTHSDRFRLRNYIEILNNRQCHLRSQCMALLKSEGQQMSHLKT